MKWKYFDDKFNSWEPERNILDRTLISLFEKDIQKKKVRNIS